MMSNRDFIHSSLLASRGMNASRTFTGNSARVGWTNLTAICPFRKMFQILIAVITATQLSACSKTVQWEEEVPLNTGDVIWVKRTVEYTLQGGAGNPLDMAYRPEAAEKLEFGWGGKTYVYEGDARVILLAISPQKIPVLVARAADSDWHFKHAYRCTTPFYVQIVPDDGGRAWTWPPTIEPWLFGLPHNLMRSRHKPEEMHQRYTAQQRTQEDLAGSTQDPSKALIDPTHKVSTCF